MRYLRLIAMLIVLLSISGATGVRAASDWNSGAPVAGETSHVYLASQFRNNTAPVSQETSTLYYGDANEDGDINMGDVTMVELIVLKLQAGTQGADANRDGKINMGDVTMIELIILKLQPRVPITPLPEVRTLTLTDSDLPQAPVDGMTFHFTAPLVGEAGPGKMQASYDVMRWPIWFGVTDGQIWFYNMPKRENLPDSFQDFYDFLDIDAYTDYTGEDGKYWLTALPPWFDLSRYDPDITTLPVLVSVSSSEGQAEIRYILAQ
jgi:hypothetical protein